MSRQAAVLLPDEVFDRLQALAARTGRTPESFVREAVEEHLEDLEDIHLAEQALDRRNRGESRSYSLDEVGRELGLDD
jgi:RHH-type transcriptional regulator, rel operon repressor / antitoxin RelB